MNLILAFLSVTIAVASGSRRVPRQYNSYRGYSYGNALPSQVRSHTSELQPYRTALCSLVPASGHEVGGDILFHQTNSGEPVEVIGTLYGLSPGLHGFHIHQNGNVSDNCKAAGSHFNPANKNHGGPRDPVRHAGDLGNVAADADGFAPVHIVDGEISLVVDNQRNIIGRSVVVHGKEDDLGKGGNAESLKTGNAGARVACCVIRMAEYSRK